MIPDVNTLKTYERIMIIFWKWRHPESGDRLDEDCDFKTVHADTKSTIFRFDPLKQRAASDAALDSQTLINSLNALQEILSNISETAQVQLFLHSSDGFRQSHINDSIVSAFRASTVKEEQHRLNYFFFQHGESDLYIGHKSHLGLLGINGNWGDLLLDDDSYFQAANDSGEIKKEHFDFIWNLFHNDYKKKVYNAAQLFIRGIVPALQTGLQSDQFLYLKNEFSGSLERGNKENNEALNHLVTELQGIFNNHPTSDNNTLKTLLPKVRTAVNTTIEKLPGSQVYVE